jgi:hypothetical protein
VSEAKVSILDPGLAKGWEEYRLVGPQEGGPLPPGSED